MKRIRVLNRSLDRSLGDQIALADGMLSRLRGMIGRPEPEPGEGMLIVPSQGVHMWWMKYALDVALLDRDRRIVAVYPELKPGSRTRLHGSARYALELPVGTLAATGTEVGDVLAWEENDHAPSRNGGKGDGRKS